MGIAVGKPQESGFTLIELMLASVILMLGLLSVASMILFALSSNHAAKLDSAALFISQQKIEELKSLPIDDPRLAGPGAPLDANSNIDFTSSLDPQYSSTTEWVLNSSRNVRVNFETRWNVSTLGTQRVITVATRGMGGTPFSTLPANLRVVKGQ